MKIKTIAINISTIIGLLLLVAGVFSAVYFGITKMDELGLETAQTEVNSYIAGQKWTSTSALRRGPGVGPFELLGGKKRRVYSVQVQTASKEPKILWIESRPQLFSGYAYEYKLR